MTNPLRFSVYRYLQVENGEQLKALKYLSKIFTQRTPKSDVRTKCLVPKEGTALFLRIPIWPPIYCFFSSNRFFARSGHMVRNKLHWDANYGVGLSKQRKVGQDWYEFLCFGSPTAWLASQCIIYSVPCNRIVQRAYYFKLHPKKLISVQRNYTLLKHLWDITPLQPDTLPLIP